MSLVRAFTPDESYDRAHASNGRSRFGAYLAARVALFRDQDDLTGDPRRFAAAAWRIAHAPVMAPPYVRTHGRVQGTSVGWDDNGRAAVRVELAVSASAEAACLAHPWRRWTRDERGRWVGPDDYQRPNAVTVLRIALPMSVMTLPRPCYEDTRPDTLTAKRAVQAVCGALNAALQHVLMFDPLSPEDAK